MADSLFRISTVGRVAAVVLLVASIGLVLGAVLSVVEVGAGVLGVVLGLLAFGALRVEVRALPEGLVVHNGIRRRVLRWTAIRGFRVDARGMTRRIVVLMAGNDEMRLPLANGGALLTSREELSTMRDTLDEYRLSAS